MGGTRLFAEVAFESWTALVMSFVPRKLPHPPSEVRRILVSPQSKSAERPRGASITHSESEVQTSTSDKPGMAEFRGVVCSLTPNPDSEL